MGFDYLDHAADMGVEAEADTLEGLLGEAARGLFGLMVNLEEIETQETAEVEARGSTPEELLYGWLSELVSLRGLRNEVYSDFQELDVERTDSEFRARGRVGGEKIDPEAQKLGTEVKAVTYQGLEVTHENDEWRCRFVVDV